MRTPVCTCKITMTIACLLLIAITSTTVTILVNYNCYAVVAQQLNQRSAMSSTNSTRCVPTESKSAFYSVPVPFSPNTVNSTTIPTNNTCMYDGKCYYQCNAQYICDTDNYLTIFTVAIVSCILVIIAIVISCYVCCIKSRKPTVGSAHTTKLLGNNKIPIINVQQPVYNTQSEYSPPPPNTIASNTIQNEGIYPTINDTTNENHV